MNLAKLNVGAKEPVWQLRLDSGVILARRRLRDAELLRVQPGARISFAAERAAGVRRGASLFFRASRGGEAGFAGVRARVQRRRASGVSSRAVVESMVVCVRARSDQFTAAVAARSRGLGLARFGGRRTAGFLGSERVSQSSSASHEPCF